jgi:hypothetical protein
MRAEDLNGFGGRSEIYVNIGSRQCCAFGGHDLISFGFLPVRRTSIGHATGACTCKNYAGAGLLLSVGFR